MRKIFGIGETVLDIILKDGQPQTAKAGGAVLNSMVSLGRIGLPVSFISEYGKDDVGKLIENFLICNDVNTNFVHRFEKENTSLALAFLDEKNDAHYSFYKEFPSKRLETIFPTLQPNDILQFGSFYAISPEIREKIKSFIQNSYNKGALIIYDPNFRKSHLSEIDILKPLIIENMRMASIVRGSDEDFMNIFGVNNADGAWDAVKNNCQCLIYTASSDGVFVKTDSFTGRFPVKPISPISTIGAGDNFNAGLIASIYNKNLNKKQLSTLDGDEWENIIEVATEFATNVCMSYENYISEEFAAEVKNRLK